MKKNVYHNNQLLCFFLFCFSILVFMPAKPLWCGQQKVTIKKEVQETASDVKIKSRAREEAFVQGLLQECRLILPASLSKSRLEILSKYIKENADRFILSYKEINFFQDLSQMSLSMSMEINDRALKEYLKKWGVYYTAARYWKYALDNQDMNAQSMALLEDLETLSGMLRVEKGFPKMMLKPMDSKAEIWMGRLETETRTFECRAVGLKKVWQTLWSEYFFMPRVRSKLLDIYILEIRGWSTSMGVENFNAQLTKWNYVLDSAYLQKIELVPGSLNGIWRVETIKKDEFQGKLTKYLKSRRLDYKIKKVVALNDNDR